MFLRRITSRKDGKVHTYWALIESIRTARGPRHRTVTYLGELGPSERAGWAEVRRILEGIPQPLPDLFDRAESPDPVPEHVEVKVRGIQVEGARDFGEVYLGWVLWRALRLDELLSAKIHLCHKVFSTQIIVTCFQVKCPNDRSNRSGTIVGRDHQRKIQKIFQLPRFICQKSRISFFPQKFFFDGDMRILW